MDTLVSYRQGGVENSFPVNATMGRTVVLVSYIGRTAGACVPLVILF
jgi:hypothetical protein